MNFILQRSPREIRAPGLVKSAVCALGISVFLVRPGLAQATPSHHIIRARPPLWPSC
jgi:hypothetical protein